LLNIRLTDRQIRTIDSMTDEKAKDLLKQITLVAMKSIERCRTDHKKTVGQLNAQAYDDIFVILTRNKCLSM
jgi:hypothetical protein